jgi:peptidoglycan hydrolase-like protein with peptidoglycan-binding domain
MYSRKTPTWDGACLSRSERVLSGLSRPDFRGTDFAAIQPALNEFGESLIVDGSFGPDTDAAVRRYQSANDLEADGLVGNRTRRSLGVRI